MTTMITPDQGAASEVAQHLLGIAEELDLNPHSIRTSTDAGFSFLVPDEVAELYLQAQAAVSEEEPSAAPKRGRPRKNQTED